MLRRRERGTKRLLWAGLVAVAGMMIFAAPRASTAQTPPVPEALNPLLYEIRTEYRTPEGETIARTTPAVLLVPIPVDVDGDLTTGAGGGDVLAQLTIDAGRAGLRVTTLPNAPADMALKIEAILSDPRQSTSFKVAFGYDALASKAPSVYSATIQLVGAARVTSFALDIQTVGAGPTIGVIAEVFDEGPGGERIDPQRGRIDYAPVPTASHFGVLQGSDFGIQQSGLDLATDTPTTVDVLIEDIRGSRAVIGRAKIAELPNIVSLVLTESDAGNTTWNYQATDVIDLVTLDITETSATRVVDDFSVRIEQMALSATLIQDTPTHMTFQADRPIGALAAGSAGGRSVAFLDEPAYVYSTDRGEGDSFAFRILGLQRAELDTGDPFVADVTIQAGPFHVLIEDGTATFDATIRDLPSRIRIALSATQGTLDWDGSAPIGEIAIVANDPEGLAGRATDLTLTLREVPASISVSWGEGSGVAMLRANNGSIGSVDLLLTSGPGLEVDPGFDGVVFEDVASHYALAARLTGLRLVSVTTGDAPYTLDLQKNAGPFLVHLTQGARDTRIEILDLPSSLQATLDPDQGSLHYTGSAGIALVTANLTDPSGVAGRATSLAIRLEDLPPSLTLGYSAADTAVVDAHGDRIGLISVLATSGPDIGVEPGFDGIVLEDVPSHYAFAVRLTGLRLASVTTGDAPYSLTLQKDAGPFLIRLLQGARSTRIEIKDLPSSLTATFDPAGSLQYSASATIGELSAVLTDPDGVAGRATKATALLRSLPATLNVTWSSAAGGTISADAQGATLGLLEILLTSGPDATLPADRDGVLIEDLTDRFVVFGRITGLKLVTFAQGPPPSFRLDTTGGRRFDVDVTTQDASGIATTVASIQNLPSSVDVRFTSATALSYTASGPVSLLTLDAFDPAGISGRAKTLHARIESIPARLDASWSPDGTITLDAQGGTIGLVEIQLTSGPDDRLATQFDGLLLRDLTDRYVVFARLTGLRRVVGTQSPLPDVTIETAAGRILKIDLEEWNGSKVEYTRATLDRLPSSVRIRIAEGAGDEMFYTASAATTSLVLDTNGGDRWNLHASISNPLPATVNFCSAGNGYCTGFQRSAGAGSFRFVASEHTTVDLFDCVRPLNSSCVRGNGEDFTDVSNWRVRHVEFDADFDSIGESGYTFMNTNSHGLTGYLLTESGSSGFEANFPSGFSANNRKVEWDLWGLFKDKSGSISCPGGTSLSVRVLGFWLGVTGYLC